MTHGRLEALGTSEPYDVCIVGSGPAGTILGTTLAARGARVLVRESGRGLLGWLTDRRIRSLAGYDFTGDTDDPRPGRLAASSEDLAWDRAFP